MSKKCFFKIILMGDGAVGKTSLRRKWLGESIDESNYVMTIGADFSIRREVIDNNWNITYQIWDLAGQPRFDQIRSGFYNGGHGALLVCDLTRPDTLENVKKWIDKMNNALGKLVPFLLIGNKADLRDQFSEGITQEAGKLYADKISKLTQSSGFTVEFLETSALTGINVNDAFHSLARKIIQLSENENEIPKVKEFESKPIKSS